MNSAPKQAALELDLAAFGAPDGSAKARRRRDAWSCIVEEEQRWRSCPAPEPEGPVALASHLCVARRRRWTSSIVSFSLLDLLAVPTGAAETSSRAAC